MEQDAETGETPAAPPLAERRGAAADAGPQYRQNKTEGTERAGAAAEERWRIERVARAGAGAQRAQARARYRP